MEAYRTICVVQSPGFRRSLELFRISGFYPLGAANPGLRALYGVAGKERTAYPTDWIARD